MFSHLRNNLILLTATLILVIQNVCNGHITRKEKLALIYLWLISFLPFVLIPTEIEELLFQTSKSQEDSRHKNYLEDLWKFYYWSNFINGWVLIPLWLGYYQSGYFKTYDRLKDSIAFNLKYYLVLLFVLMAASVIIIFSYEKNTSQLFFESHLLLNSM